MNRGYKSLEDISSFINIPTKIDFSSWDKETSTHIGNRIKTAIENNELITIYGDYDVDGITSTVVLSEFLKSKGANFNYFLPDRFKQGYGMDNQTIQELYDNGTKIIITVDCGVSNFEEINFAKQIGLDVIITDHHTIPERLPNADFIFNPSLSSKKEFHILSGVGTVFYLISNIDDLIPSKYEVQMEDYLDLVALGTVADVCSLKGVNRAIVKRGLEKIKITKRLGLLKLIELTKIKIENISEIDFSFKIIPRLNAAGRMSQASISLKLLLSETEEEASTFANVLENLNKDRQEITKKIIDELEEAVEKDLLPEDNFIMLTKENLHHGIVGVLCSRLSEKYNKPIFLMSEEDGILRGSARSHSINLVESLRTCSHILDKFGGHKGAAGWTLKKEDFNEFKNKIELYAKENTSHEIQEVNIDAIVSLDELSYKLYKDIKILSPFGQDNSLPILCLKDCYIQNQYISKNGKHLFGEVKHNDKTFKVNFWNHSKLYSLDEKYDMIFTLEESNRFNQINLELNIIDIKKSLVTEITEINVEITKLIKEIKYYAYITNNLGEHKLTLENSTETYNTEISLKDCRFSKNPEDELLKILKSSDEINFNILTSKQIKFKSDVINTLKSKTINENNESHLIIWFLPLKKEHLHHIMNIIKPKCVYVFSK